jgi:hypothetical protein
MCYKPGILSRMYAQKIFQVNRDLHKLVSLKIIYVKYLHTHLSPPVAGSWREKINLSKDTF